MSTLNYIVNRYFYLFNNINQFKTTTIYCKIFEVAKKLNMVNVFIMVTFLLPLFP